MARSHLHELCLAAKAEVTVRPHLADRTPEEKTPNKSSVGINGVVTMETRRRVEKEEPKKEEEERWRKLYPEIKKCLIVIPRHTLDTLKQISERRVEEWGGRRRRSGDPETRYDWMQPLELEDTDDKVRFRRFVKKVEVSVQPDYVRESSMLTLRQSPDVTTDPAHRRHRCPRSSPQSKGVTEDCGPIRDSEKEINDYLRHLETDHNYCINKKNTPDVPNGQSQDGSLSSSCGDEDGGGSSTEKKNPPTMVVKKVRGDQWVLRNSEDKKEEDEEEDEDEEGSTSNTDQRKLRREKSQIQTDTLSIRRVVKQQWMHRKRRRQACGRCVACLRKDCGECTFCLDKRKFGGPGKKKQRCRNRCCLVVHTMKFRPETVETVEDREETVTMATETTKQCQKKTQRDDEEKEVKVKRSGTWGLRWGGKRMTCRMMKKKEERERKTPSAAQEEMRRIWRLRWRRRKAKRKSEDDGCMEEEEEEEEPKKETQPPQLSLTLDGSRFSPSIPSDSTLTINNQSGLLPQDVSTPHVSTGLLSAPPLLLQPKEEEEVVEITRNRRLKEDEGRTEETRSEGAMDRGQYYDVEVEVEPSDSDSETLTASSSEFPEDIDDLIALDPSYKPPEFISLSSSSFSLLGGGLSDEVTCGRSLMQLLWMLRSTVLPAHWVPVLADGPLLQLLQCSKLSSMADTIVHIQPDHCLYITIQNRQLPDTHPLYRTHSQRITHLSQLVSLLLELERLIICQGLKVRSPAGPLEVRSPTCHLLVAPPCLTCLPCLLQEEEEEDTEEEDEVREDEMSP